MPLLKLLDIMRKNGQVLPSPLLGLERQRVNVDLAYFVGPVGEGVVHQDSTCQDEQPQDGRECQSGEDA
jgi:hypothetical protein